MISARDFRDILELPPLKRVVDSLFQDLPNNVKIVLLEKIRRCISNESPNITKEQRVDTWYDLMESAKEAKIPLHEVDTVLEYGRKYLPYISQVSEDIAKISWLQDHEKMCTYFHTYILEDPRRKFSDYPALLHYASDFIIKMQGILKNQRDDIETVEIIMNRLLKKAAFRIAPNEAINLFEHLGTLPTTEKIYEEMVYQYPAIRIYGAFSGIFTELCSNFEACIEQEKAEIEPRVVSYVEHILPIAKDTIARLQAQQNALIHLLQSNQQDL